MILPPLSQLLIQEQQRHYDEVASITRFHKFMTDFEENGGLIDGKVYKLSGLSIENCVASFKGEHGDYFFDGHTKNPAYL